MLFVPEAVLTAALSIFVFLALCAALVLVTVRFRRPTDAPLLVAGALAVLCLIVVAIAPFNLPPLFGVILATLGTALAVIGGNPIVRRVLAMATHGEVHEGSRGGILVFEAPKDDAARESEEVLRGGTTIGYLERIGVVLSIVAGFPEAIAIVVAVKGIGRFSELATSAARERFIVGTLASLLWAGVVGALVRLAIW